MKYSEKEVDYLKQAIDVSKLSMDPSTKVGALLAAPNGEVFLGFNHIPEALLEPNIYEDREKKYENVIHAEMDVLARAPANASSFELFTSFCVCPVCAPHIVHRGIKSVVTLYPDMEMPRLDVWSGYWKRALRILTNGGVNVKMYRRDLAGVMCFYPGRRNSFMHSFNKTAIDFRDD